jgi:signal recognition particle GTPase
VSKQAERDKTIKIEKKKFYYNDSGQVLPSMARMGVLKLAL